MKKRQNAAEQEDLQRRLERLRAAVDAMGGGREHRREALVERAESRGLERGHAEQAYDVAVEVGLEPALGLAVVGEGISVRSFGRGPAVDASEAVEPEWIDRPPAAADAALERRLRETFRRLRSFLDSEPTTQDALARFASEPDLEAYDY